ncbi:MAG TPA: hypothetical protein VLR26_02080 [Frankiaceae bacterium]|nr:hypothetical protein [Frankiaceae bacterium]
MRYDRRVSEELLQAISDDGPLAGLIDLVRADRGHRDLQLRRVKQPECWATLYVGLTKVLDVRERNGSFRLDAHEAYRELSGFDESWRLSQPLEDLQNCWQEVLAYVETAISAVPPEYTSAEGAVQSAMSSGITDEFRVVDREAVLGHTNSGARSGTLDPVEKALTEALVAAGNGEPWWPGARGKVSFGGELDLLAIDEAGRLLVIMVKPANAVAGIAKSPAQVALYATLWSMWLDESDDATEVLQGMLDQRARLGLGRAGPIVPPTTVVPVIAIGPGKRSKEALPRLQHVAKAVQPVLDTQQSLQPLEVWLVDEQGRVDSKEVLGLTS